MIRAKPLKTVMGFAAALLFLVACGAPQPTMTPPATAIANPTATNEPTAIPEPTIPPTETTSELFYVALGDSYAVCCGVHTYPEYYAEFIEEDLGVGVKLFNLATSGDTSDDLLEKLGSDYYRNAVAKAQVVTVVITANDLLQCRQGAERCSEEDVATAMANYRQILEEILAVVSTEDTIIRAQTYDHFYVTHWQEVGVFEERKAMMDHWNEQLVEIATEYNIPVARVYQDFNGPNGDQDPGEKGYLAPDRLHPSDEGSRRIAELLRELGYQPLMEE